MSSCEILSRREILRRSGMGIGALALADLIHRESAGASPTLKDPLAARPGHFPAKAKTVIFLFMQGGPSHLETFDPKPVLKKHAGSLLPKRFKQFDLAQINTADARCLAPQFPFRQHGKSGIAISTIFPQLAKHADDLAVIRSCYHESFIHGPAMKMMNTGTVLLAHPSVGSWVAYGLGTESDRLPAFITMTDSFFRNGSATFNSGFLPAVFQGTYLRTEGAPIQNLSRPSDLSSRSQRTIVDQINAWNRRHRQQRPGDSRLDARITNYELAFRMQSAAPELIDISGETKQTRSLYGLENGVSNRFGKMCLLARRMAERGVRYIHLVSGGWDAHGNCRGNHVSQGKKVDQPIAGLLADLKQRGMLDSTLIVWSGEFGRTPIMQGSNGRDHHPYGYSTWMAGGGIRGGKVIGATDDFGFHAVDDKVHVNDLHATMMTLMGLDHEKLTYLFEGRNRRLTDVGGDNNLADRLIREG